MGIVKKVKELFTGKPAKSKTKKLATAKPAAKTDPNLEALRKKAKEHGGKIKLKPGTAEPTKAPKRGK
jgi:hypothetical protein